MDFSIMYEARNFFHHPYKRSAKSDVTVAQVTPLKHVFTECHTNKWATTLVLEIEYFDEYTRLKILPAISSEVQE